MLTAEHIVALFTEINERLQHAGKTGEIGIVGGAVMCLVYKARAATRDVDAVFEPSAELRSIVQAMAEEHGLPENWLNDAAKAYIQGDFERENVLMLSNLRVWAPDARYMLAMKCVSARWDTYDRDDVLTLIQHLRLTRPQHVFELIEEYFPRRQILPKTQFLLEEVFENGV